MLPTWVRRVIALIGFSVIVATITVGIGSSPAQAASRNGVCETGEFCYYYNSDNAGSVSDHGASLANYGTDPATCYVFKGPGAGRSQCIKNNAASVWNRTSSTIRVYYNSNYGGSYVDIGPGTTRNLKGSCCYNQNASHGVKPSGTALTPITTGVYKASGTINAGFDGYKTTKGRHEGIDVDRSLGARVYALSPGTVIRVTEGSRGSAGLSQIAVYNESLKTTVLYLHLDPSIRVGATVARGTFIGYQDWRGVSSSGASHTHVEMRPGRQLSAAESVCTGSEVYNPSDPCNILENPNPTSFWKARGFDSLR